MGGPSRPNQGPTAIIGAKAEQDKDKREQLRWMCLQLAAGSFTDGNLASDEQVTQRAEAFYTYITTMESE